MRTVRRVGEGKVRRGLDCLQAEILGELRAASPIDFADLGSQQVAKFGDHPFLVIEVRHQVLAAIDQHLQGTAPAPPGTKHERIGVSARRQPFDSAFDIALAALQ